MTKYENKWKDFIQEACWDGYERVEGTEEGEPGSCKEITEEESDIEEGKICDKGISYVLRTDPGGKDIHRGDKDTDGDGEKEIKNWSARAAQIASKYCKDPNYGKGRGKDAKDEAVVEEDGGLDKWTKEKWVHSDGTPCGGGKEDGSKSRCKPPGKWAKMSKSEKKADNAKKAAGTKAGKQYVPATKKGKVKKSDRLESLEKIIREEIDAVLDEKKKKPCKPSKGKRYAKRVDGKCRSYGQAGKESDGTDRIEPGTDKGHAYCARSAKIKKCKEPPCANDLSRKKWKCQGDRSVP